MPKTKIRAVPNNLTTKNSTIRRSKSTAIGRSCKRADNCAFCRVE